MFKKIIAYVLLGVSAWITFSFVMVGMFINNGAFHVMLIDVFLSLRSLFCIVGYLLCYLIIKKKSSIAVYIIQVIPLLYIYSGQLLSDSIVLYLVYVACIIIATILLKPKK